MASPTPDCNSSQTRPPLLHSLKRATFKLSGRSRVSIVLAISTMFLLCIALNLKSIYGRGYYRYGGGGYYYYPPDNTTHTVSMVFECILSVILISMLALVTPSAHFISNVAVGLTVMGMYIFITFLVDPGAQYNSRLIATWSVLSFWIGFAFEAFLKVGYHVTGWLAAKIEDKELGRIRLDGEESVLPHAEYRDIPIPRQLQADQVDARVASLDLERGEQSPSKSGSDAGN